MSRLFPGGGGSTFSEAELLGLKTLDFKTLGLYCQISPKHLTVVSYLPAVNQSAFFFTCLEFLNTMTKKSFIKFMDKESVDILCQIYTVR